MVRVVIFSGAGISAESGVATFRDSGGLWEQYKIEEVCSFDSLEKNRSHVIEFYNKRRQDIANKEPNAAHKEIAKLQKQFPKDIKIITQNVDDLFERAGCVDVLHVHGKLRELRCELCSYTKDIGYREQDDTIDICPTHNRVLRPNIVFFGEMAPLYKKMYEYLEQCEFFVSIGMSGAVIDVNSLAAYATKRAILNNLEPSELIAASNFDKVLYKRATEAIVEISIEIRAFLEEA